MYQIIAANLFSLTRKQQMMVTAILLALVVSILLVVVFAPDSGIMAGIKQGLEIAGGRGISRPLPPPIM